MRGAKAATVVACGLTPFLAKIFLISGFTRLIPVFDGLVEARADLMGAPAPPQGPPISA